jgi:hypothetical protein
MYDGQGLVSIGQASDFLGLSLQDLFNTIQSRGIAFLATEDGPKIMWQDVLFLHEEIYEGSNRVY